MAKADIGKGLADLLSDTFFLYQNTLLAHWNVMGSGFPQIHKLFKGQYEELADASDAIAEQMRALQFLVSADFSKGDGSKANKATSNAEELMRTLLKGHEACIECATDLADVAKAENDEGTLTLAADRLNAHRKHAWMLRATLA